MFKVKLALRVLQACLLTLLDVSATLVFKVLVNWWAVYFRRDGSKQDRGETKYGPVLPDWLAWADTFDACLDQGVIDGSVTGQSEYATSLAWLNRNTAYGFSYWVEGISFNKEDWQWSYESYDAGYKKFKAWNTKTGHFNYFFVSPSMNFKIKFGWKAWNMFKSETLEWNDKPWGPEFRIPFVFSIGKVS